MNKILVIRMRGEAKTRRDVRDTFGMLGMKKIYSFALVENNPSNMGMVRKVENFAAWGEVSPDIEKSLGDIKGLKPPKGGLKSKKLRFPRGNLGYCGDKINDLAMRMM